MTSSWAGDEMAENTSSFEPHSGKISGSPFHTRAISRAQLRFLTLTNSLSSSSSSTVITSGDELSSRSWIQPRVKSDVTKAPLLDRSDSVPVSGPALRIRKGHDKLGPPLRPARGDGMHSAQIEVLSKFAETCYQVTRRHGEAAITLSRNGLPKYPLGGNAGARANPSGLTSIQIRLKTNVPGQFA